MAQIDYCEQSYTCDAVLSNNALKLTLTYPEEIKDLTLLVDKNGLSAEFKGVSFESDIESIPQSVLPYVLFDALSDVMNKTIECDAENCKLKGTIKNYEYEFIISPSGLPISLTVDDLSLKIKFNNVTLI